MVFIVGTMWRWIYAYIPREVPPEAPPRPDGPPIGHVPVPMPMPPMPPFPMPPFAMPMGDPQAMAMGSPAPAHCPAPGPAHRPEPCPEPANPPERERSPHIPSPPQYPPPSRAGSEKPEGEDAVGGEAASTEADTGHGKVKGGGTKDWKSGVRGQARSPNIPQAFQVQMRPTPKNSSPASCDAEEVDSDVDDVEVVSTTAAKKPRYVPPPPKHAPVESSSGTDDRGDWDHESWGGWWRSGWRSGYWEVEDWRGSDKK